MCQRPTRAEFDHTATVGDHVDDAQAVKALAHEAAGLAVASAEAVPAAWLPGEGVTSSVTSRHRRDPSGSWISAAHESQAVPPGSSRQ